MYQMVDSKENLIPQIILSVIVWIYLFKIIYVVDYL